MKLKYLLLILLFAFSASSSFAQFKGYKVKGGAHYFMISPSGEFVKDLSSFMARGFLAIELGNYVDVEIGGGYMKWKQKTNITVMETVKLKQILFRLICA